LFDFIFPEFDLSMTEKKTPTVDQNKALEEEVKRLSQTMDQLNIRLSDLEKSMPEVQKKADGTQRQLEDLKRSMQELTKQPVYKAVRVKGVSSVPSSFFSSQSSNPENPIIAEMRYLQKAQRLAQDSNAFSIAPNVTTFINATQGNDLVLEEMITLYQRIVSKNTINLNVYEQSLLYYYFLHTTKLFYYDSKNKKWFEIHLKNNQNDFEKFVIAQVKYLNQEGQKPVVSQSLQNIFDELKPKLGGNFDSLVLSKLQGLKLKDVLLPRESVEGVKISMN
jgi:hypothetical protein